MEVVVIMVLIIMAAVQVGSYSEVDTITTGMEVGDIVIAMRATAAEPVLTSPGRTTAEAVEPAHTNHGKRTTGIGSNTLYEIVVQA